jgi:simple sugar transport system permease protein
MPSFLKSLLPAVGAVVLALIGGAILIALGGVSPMAAYAKLWQGATGLSPHWPASPSLATLWPHPAHLGNSLTEATPLILAGLAVSLPLTCGLFNIGAEGQILMGGLGATLVGLHVQNFPDFLQPFLACLGGVIFGAAWAAIPAALRVYRGLNEIIMTIMLNFIAFWFISYLVHGPMKDTEGYGYPWSPEVPASAQLGEISHVTRINSGLLIAVAVSAVLAVIIRKTTIGYQLRAVGVSALTSRFAGLRVPQIMMGSMVLGGGLAGLAGAVVTLGVQYRLSDAFSPGYGYDAIAIAFVGQGTPLGVLFAGIFFGAFRVGAESMELSLGVPKSISAVVQALALIFAVLSQARWFELWWNRRKTLTRLAREQHGPVAPAPLR